MRNPIREMAQIAVPLTRSFLRPGGAALRDRVAGLKIVLAAVLATLRDPRRDMTSDPLQRARKVLLRDPARLRELETRIEQETGRALASALAEVPA